MNNLIIKI